MVLRQYRHPLYPMGSLKYEYVRGLQKGPFVRSRVPPPNPRVSLQRRASISTRKQKPALEQAGSTINFDVDAGGIVEASEHSRYR